MRCLNNKKKIKKKNLPVLYGKAVFNISIEVTAEKLAENLKKTLSEKKLFILFMPTTEPRA